MPGHHRQQDTSHERVAAPPDLPRQQVHRKAAFRAYADFMLSEEFEVGLKELMSLAQDGQLALMCAEATPWRCHRTLLSDRLTACGVAVSHILNPERVEPHHLTPFARVEGEQVTYPAEQPALQL